MEIIKNNDLKELTAQGTYFLDSLTVNDYYPFSMLNFDKLSNRDQALSVIEPAEMMGIEKDDDINGKGRD
jgi:hypothetical protein